MSRDVVRGAIAGAVAGLAAAYVMNAFQSAWSAAEKKLEADDDQEEGGGEPATVKAADKVSQATAGHAVPEENRETAGQAVHYATGALVGAVYGGLAEVLPQVTTGFGAVYGMVVNLVLDETLVPAAGLGPSPFKTPAKTHAYGAASHSVYGLALELVRRAARNAL